MSSAHSRIATGSNTIWLTIPSIPENLLIQTYLLGMGADQSLLCALPEPQHLETLECGALCKGRSFIDGEIYEFETVIQEMLTQPPAIRLEAPENISRETPRSFPRLAVDLTGTVRPLNDKGQVLAVLPARLIDLSPTGCQFAVTPSAWPRVSSMHMHITCRLPGFHHQSKFPGFIGWVHPAKELVMGTQFLFTSDKDVSKGDLLRWYTSQKARLVNTTA